MLLLGGSFCRRAQEACALALAFRLETALVRIPRIRSDELRDGPRRKLPPPEPFRLGRGQQYGLVDGTIGDNQMTRRHSAFTKTARVVKIMRSRRLASRWVQALASSLTFAMCCSYWRAAREKQPTSSFAACMWSDREWLPVFALWTRFP